MAKRSAFKILKRKILFSVGLIFAAWFLYYIYWGRHLFLITAYCNCPVCINVKKYQDNKFASGKPVYWGGIAADPSVPFGSHVKIFPQWPQDWAAMMTLLRGRNDFIVEDRGGKIKGKHLDLFIPDSMGGHHAAKNWGVRRMRIKLNGEWVE